MVSHRHRDSRVPLMQKSSSAPLRRRLAYLLPLHHRHRWRTHHPRSHSHVACTTSLALEAPHLGCGWADSASGGLGGGSEGRSEGSGRLIERSFPTCTALLGYPSHFTVHVVPLPVPCLSFTTPLCTGLASHDVSSSVDHAPGLTFFDVHQHVASKTSYGRGAIAQRVGMGLGPGKLRKKALGEGNKKGELTRAIRPV